MRIIIAQFSDGRVESYSTVKLFLSANKLLNLSYDTIMHHITREGKEQYKDENVTLTRVLHNKQRHKKLKKLIG